MAKNQIIDFLSVEEIKRLKEIEKLITFAKKDTVLNYEIETLEILKRGYQRAKLHLNSAEQSAAKEEVCV